MPNNVFALFLPPYGTAGTIETTNPERMWNIACHASWMAHFICMFKVHCGTFASPQPEGSGIWLAKACLGLKKDTALYSTCACEAIGTLQWVVFKLGFRMGMIFNGMAVTCQVAACTSTSAVAKHAVSFFRRCSTASFPAVSRRDTRARGQSNESVI